MKASIILIILGTALISGMIGSRLQQKLDQKEENYKLQVQPIAVNKNQPSLPLQPGRQEFSLLYFQVREQDTPNIKDEATRKKLEDLFQTKKFPVNISVSEKTALSAVYTVPQNNTRMQQMGIVDSTRFAAMLAKKRNAEPIFFTSPRENHACTTDLQLIVKKDSPISSVEDLDKKSIALSLNTSGMIPILFKSFREKRLKANQVHIFNDPTWGTVNLMDGKVDAVIDRVNSYDDNKTIGTYGHFENGAYPDFPNLKVIKSTNIKLPCDVVFLFKIFSEQDRALIVNKLKDVFFNPKNNELLKAALKVGSAREVKPDEWKQYQDILGPEDNFSFNMIARETVLNEY